MSQPIDPMAERENVQGTVEWFSKEKGYGFIIRDDTKTPVFVHYSGIYVNNPKAFRTLTAEQRVKFDLMFDEKKMKPIATNVRVIS